MKNFLAHWVALAIGGFKHIPPWHRGNTGHQDHRDFIRMQNKKKRKRRNKGK